MRRNRNKNPNCNHNATSVFYQPHYNNVKYDETNQKKEEVLKKFSSRKVLKWKMKERITALSVT